MNFLFRGKGGVWPVTLRRYVQPQRSVVPVRGPSASDMPQEDDFQFVKAFRQRHQLVMAGEALHFATVIH